MPVINFDLTLTDDEFDAFQEWFAVMNASIDTPYDSPVAFGRYILMEQVNDAVNWKDQFNLKAQWETLTPDQRARIRAIAGE